MAEERDLMIPCGNKDTCGYVMPENEVNDDKCPLCGAVVNRNNAIDMADGTDG